MKRIFIALLLMALLAGCIILHHRENSPEDHNHPACKVNCN